MLKKNDEIAVESYEATADQADRGGLGSILAKGAAQLVLMALVLGFAFFVTMRLVSTKPEVPKKAIFPTVYTVDTVTAKAMDHQPLITLYGEILAGRSVDLRGLVSGEITSINPELHSGGHVAAGETLLQIDKFTYEGQLREAKANAAETEGRLEEADARIQLEESRLANSREQLELAVSDLTRIEKLRANGTATQKQVEDRQLVLSQRSQLVNQSEINIGIEKAKQKQLKATADRLAWKIEQSVRNVKNTRLVAPFDATIRSSAAEVGKLTTANDVLVSMYEADKLEARFVLTDEQFGRLQSDGAGVVGRKIKLIWNVGGKDHTYPGTIDRIGAEIASARGGVELFAIVGSSDQMLKLRPGAFVEIKLPDHIYAGHFQLPDSSLYNGNTVYVVKNGELAKRIVNVSAYDGDNILVADGIDNGDEVLTTRISEISAGLKVRKEGSPEKSPDQKKKDNQQAIKKSGQES